MGIAYPTTTSGITSLQEVQDRFNGHVVGCAGATYAAVAPAQHSNVAEACILAASHHGLLRKTL